MADSGTKWSVYCFSNINDENKRLSYFYFINQYFFKLQSILLNTKVLVSY